MVISKTARMEFFIETTTSHSQQGQIRDRASSLEQQVMTYFDKY